MERGEDGRKPGRVGSRREALQIYDSKNTGMCFKS